MRELPQYDWTLKAQRSRHFSWRVRASDWIWGLEDDAKLEQSYDLIVATSLSGLAGLKALRPHLASTPTWVYFHENQFAYPLEDRQSETHQIGWQFSSLQNVLCGDWVSFNTAFNRETFIEGMRALLKRMPERLPGDPVGMIEAHSDVLPVPLYDAFAGLRACAKNPQLILWNHRWEWDKQPERCLRALIELKQEGLGFRFAMLGCGGAEDGRFAEERAALGDAVVHWGEADPETYGKWMGEAGIAVSCALHDFQGLAVQEAAQAGATLVVPERVAYPECVPGALFYKGSADDAEEDIASLKAVLREALHFDAPRALALEQLPHWSYWKDDYARRIEGLLGR
jgi:glycosyltransferase involved in cell wall biosynthesis